MFTSRRLGARIAATSLLAIVTGCQALPDTHGVLVGRVIAPAQVAGPFVIAAIDRDAGTIRHRVFLEEPGPFTMRIDPGAYKFIAFADSNRDGKLGNTEAVSARMALKTAVEQGDTLALPPLAIRTP
jgi:hypothetical protein